MLVMLIAGTPPTHAWVMFGVAIRRFLSSPLRLRMFNVSMAALLMLSILPML
jgi:threonine/homoserine/homoserine lactone efflux protein